MPNFVAFCVFAGMEFFKRLSIFLLKTSDNLLCNAIFLISFQPTLNFKLMCNKNS